MQTRIILLAGDRDTTPIVYNALAKCTEVSRVIIEPPITRSKLLRWRAKRYGVTSVVGQSLFALFMQPLLAWSARGRRKQIVREASLKDQPIPNDVCVRVASVNDDAVISELETIKPTHVVVHGTRILSKKVLRSVGAPFVNIHAGITPRYRGSHGAYWALVEKDRERCGVTVHLVDEGIDTGPVLAQAKIGPTSRDNFATYPLLQLAVGLTLLCDLLAAGTLVPQNLPLDEDSRVWAHPTLWGYLWHRIRDGVK
jgi:Formyl transferase